MKIIYFSFSLFVSFFIMAQSYTIDTLVDKSPYFPSEIYRFPILKGDNDSITNLVNTKIVEDYLWGDFNDDRKSVFSNIWANENDETPMFSDLEFCVNVLNFKMYSVSLTSTGCGTYCERGTKSFNFDLKNGHKIELNQLVQSPYQKIALDYLSMRKQTKIQTALNWINDSLSVLKPDQDITETYTQMKDMYVICLAKSTYTKLSEFEFYTTQNQIVLQSERCFPHVIKSIDNLGTFNFRFEIAKIKKYLSNYGKEILL